MFWKQGWGILEGRWSDSDDYQGRPEDKTLGTSVIYLIVMLMRYSLFIIIPS